MRTIIELSDELTERLDGYCRANQMARVACIREALQLYLEARPIAPKTPEAYFASWAHRTGDSLTIESAYREEW